MNKKTEIKNATNNVYDLAKALEVRGITLDVEKLQNASGAVKAKTEIIKNKSKVIKMAAEKAFSKVAA